jgi:GTPase SAR1 family protein
MACSLAQADVREVSWEQGHEVAKAGGCLFVEASAKTGHAVNACFEELVEKVLECPWLHPDSRDQQERDGRHISITSGRPTGSISSACPCG